MSRKVCGSATHAVSEVLRARLWNKLPQREWTSARRVCGYATHAVSEASSRWWNEITVACVDEPHTLRR